MNALKHLLDIFSRTKYGAKGHRHNGMILHDGLHHMLMSQGVITRGIKDEDRSTADNGSNITVMDGENIFLKCANAAPAKAAGNRGLDDAINIQALMG